MKIKHFLVIISSLLCSLQAVADTDLYPNFHNYFQFNGDHFFIRHDKTPVIFTLKNVSSQPIFINIIKHNGTAQAGYASLIESQHISAFMLGGDTPSLRLACYNGATPGLTKLACKDVIEATAYPQPTVNDSSPRNYWLVESAAPADLVSKITELHVSLGQPEAL